MRHDRKALRRRKRVLERRRGKLGTVDRRRFADSLFSADPAKDGARTAIYHGSDDSLISTSAPDRPCRMRRSAWKRPGVPRKPAEASA